MNRLAVDAARHFPSAEALPEVEAQSLTNQSPCEVAEHIQQPAAEANKVEPTEEELQPRVLNTG